MIRPSPWLPLPAVLAGTVLTGVVLSATVLSCAGVSTPTGDVCADAAAHLEQCAGLSLPATGGACDAAEATQLLGTPCGQLSSALANPKSDGAGPLARFACKMGLYAVCPPVACEEAVGVADPREDPTDCAAWTAFEGCASCGYYACREAISHCGPDGYLVDYAGRYCHRFATITEPRVSPAAAKWLHDIRRCLIDHFEAEVPYDASCQVIAERGFGAHAACYVQTGFCELSPLDWLGILQTIDTGDIPLRSVLETAQGCLREWLGH